MRKSGTNLRHKIDGKRKKETCVTEREQERHRERKEKVKVSLGEFERPVTELSMVKGFTPSCLHIFLHPRLSICKCQSNMVIALRSLHRQNMVVAGSLKRSGG